LETRIAMRTAQDILGTRTQITSVEEMAIPEMECLLEIRAIIASVIMKRPQPTRKKLSQTSFSKSIPKSKEVEIRLKILITSLSSMKRMSLKSPKLVE
jgi:hypothetical protein